MNEKLIEKKLREGVKKAGGLALKLSAPYFTGMPDRLIILPEGRVKFVEVKSTGKKPDPLQVSVINRLKAIGHDAVVIDNQESLTEFLSRI